MQTSTELLGDHGPQGRKYIFQLDLKAFQFQYVPEWPGNKDREVIMSCGCVKKKKDEEKSWG